MSEGRVPLPGGPYGAAFDPGWRPTLIPPHVARGLPEGRLDRRNDDGIATETSRLDVSHTTSNLTPCASGNVRP